MAHAFGSYSTAISDTWAGGSQDRTLLDLWPARLPFATA